MILLAGPDQSSVSVSIRELVQVYFCEPIFLLLFTVFVLSQAIFKLCILLMLYAMQARLHSPDTDSLPRSMKPRNPITALIKDVLQDSLQTLRQRAKRINSSDVVEKIQALLLAPVISGSDGVEDALDGLSMILASAKEQKQSIALAYAYDPLLLLINKKADIAQALNMSVTDFEDKLKPFHMLLMELWRKATENPLVLAGFSFPPPIVVDPIIIHNWAFTSIRFAELFQKRQEMDDVLSQAVEAQPTLVNGITLARATQSVVERSDSFNASDVHLEDRDSFYSALGRRLVVLERLGGDKGAELCLALTEQCLKQGPSEIDAAVFLAAIRLDLTTKISKQCYAHYMKRLDNMRDLRLKLMPILRMFEDGKEATDD